MLNIEIRIKAIVKQNIYKYWNVVEYKYINS